MPQVLVRVVLTFEGSLQATANLPLRAPDQVGGAAMQEPQQCDPVSVAANEVFTRQGVDEGPCRKPR